MEDKENQNPNLNNQNPAPKQDDQKTDLNNQDSAAQQNDQPEDMFAGTDEQPTPTSAPQETNIPPQITPTTPPQANVSPQTPTTPPPPADNTPSPVENTPEPKQNRAWIWIVIAIVLLALATATTYFLGIWPFAGLPSIITQEEPTESFVPLLHRTSTLPSGELKINGSTITANVNNLETSPTGQFTYKLVLSNNVSEQELGSFAGTNTDGNIVDEEGNVVTLALNNTEDYDTAKVIIYDARDEARFSVILQGAIEQNVAELNFPYDYLNINAGAVLEEVKSGENLIEFTFDNLPNVADIGYIYEARVAEFDGPYVMDELSLGKFSGTGQRTTFTAVTEQNLTKYNQLVISLEPVWDRDPTISQIKPFSGNI